MYYGAEQIVVNALMFAIPAIFNVLLVCLVFWLVFSILGVQLFGGKFYKCIDDETGERYSPQVIDTKADCLNRNLTWTNSPIHFDHVGHAYLALFQVVSLFFYLPFLCGGKYRQFGPFS